jgi:membrane protease YdiL (CAAX protease family)
VPGRRRPPNAPGYRGGVEALPRRTLRNEVLLVLGVSLGASAAYAIVTIIGRLTATAALSQQQATLNPSQAPNRPWLDLAYQLLGIVSALVPALLAAHLLQRDQAGGAAATLGLRPARPAFDAATGAGLAALIGIPGLALYAAARALGISANVVPEALPSVWWAVPVLILSAIQNAVLEEVVVVGYLVTRLRQFGWGVPPVIAASALLRGSYHLYQGFGGFIGNAVMGVIFVAFFLQVRRLAPLIIAHAIVDTVSFVGYALLHGRVWFLS